MSRTKRTADELEEESSEEIIAILLLSTGFGETFLSLGSEDDSSSEGIETFCMLGGTEYMCLVPCGRHSFGDGTK